MLKLRTLTVTALAGRFGHSSGTFGHRRGYIRLVALLFYVHGKHLRSCRDGQLA